MYFIAMLALSLNTAPLISFVRRLARALVAARSPFYIISDINWLHFPNVPNMSQSSEASQKRLFPMSPEYPEI